jgi:Leucine-rich repeat (LRR) protein
LGALLSANLPSLRTLSVTGCNLGDEGLALLLDGLAANTHLRKLDCPLNDPSEAFKRNRLDPTLAALAARARFDA